MEPLLATPQRDKTKQRKVKRRKKLEKRKIPSKFKNKPKSAKNFLYTLQFHFSV
jgi:hypothetical protein